MAAYTLELVSLFLLCGVILGCRLRKNPALLTAAAALLLFHYVAFIFFPKEWIPPLWPVWIGIPVVVLPMLFKGRALTLLGVGLILRLLFRSLDGLLTGILLLSSGGDMQRIDMTLTYCLGVVVCIAAELIIAWLFRRRREKIRFHLEQTSPWLFAPVIVWLGLIQIDVGYSYGLTQRSVQIINGIHLIKNGILTLLTIFLLLTILVLLSQRREMKRLAALNERCISEQTEQYHLLSQRDESLRRFRHDYNAHIHALQALSTGGSAEELADYIRQLSGIKEEFHMLRTGNLIGDAIFNRYYRLCEEAQISFSVSGKLSEKSPLPETALCVLLTNGMKNAYEAAQKCKGKKYIDVELKRLDEKWFILIRNSAEEKLNFKDGRLVTTKADRENHGYGSGNMLETAHRYGGDVIWSHEADGSVLTTIFFVQKTEAER